MRRALLFAGGLLLASVAVFLAVYLGGRRRSLEEELARLRSAPAEAPPKTRGIPSLQAPVPPPPPPPEEGVPVEESVAEGVVVTRSPLPPPAVALVLDLESVGAGYRDAVAAFLARPPLAAGLAVRALGGGPGDCGRTLPLRALGPWSGGEPLAALDGGLAALRGPRHPALAVEEAVADLEAAEGERAVILVAGGGDGCGADPCAAPAPGGGFAARVHAVLLVPAAEEGAAEDPADAGFPGEPPWVAGYRCLAERTGGSLVLVADPEELVRHLGVLAQGLESAIVVRAYHGRDEELLGIAPEGAEWGASLTARGAGDGEGAVRFSPSLPAVFTVPAGTWDLRCQYDGGLRRAGVAVAPGERAEVRVTFATGELYVEARDDAGGEIAGDSAGFGCLWGAEVFPEGEGDAVAATCALPARIELPAGGYRVLVRWKDRELSHEGVVVEAGGTTMRTSDFGTPQE